MKRFEELVDNEFLEKWSGRFSKDFGIVDQDGKISYSRIYDVYKDYDGEHRPNLFMYVLIHGASSFMTTWDVPAQFRGREEDIYAMCLEKDIAWEDLIGKQKTSDNILL